MFLPEFQCFTRVPGTREEGGLRRYENVRRRLLKIHDVTRDENAMLEEEDHKIHDVTRELLWKTVSYMM